MNPPAASDEASSSAAELTRDEERAVLLAAIRTLAVRYAVLMPKFKAVAFLQPEDHVSKGRIAHDLKRGPQSSRFFLSITHNGSIFAAGTMLFLGQEFALRRLEPQSHGDFTVASCRNTSISGGVGGLLYSLCATSAAAWVGTKGNSILLQPEKRLRFLAFLRKALPYTLLRDGGGFALYFGVYASAQSYARKHILSKESDAQLMSAGSNMKGNHAGKTLMNGDDKAVSAAKPSASPEVAETDPTTHKLRLLTDSPAVLARGVGIAAASGGAAGLITYLWRSPLDTLYKRAVGWRDADAPLWSFRRFLTSPRGGKAVAIGAATWSAYEVADAGIRALAGQ